MLVIPLVINIFIFWMTDNFLMMEDKTKYKVFIQGKLLDRYLFSMSLQANLSNLQFGIVYSIKKIVIHILTMIKIC